jgi:hypothetical protein
VHLSRLLAANEPRRTSGGETVNDNDPLQGENLEDGARQANSRLQRLIEAIGGVLAVSGDLLGRLQQILSGTQPAAGGADGPNEPGTPPPADRRDC